MKKRLRKSNTDVWFSGVCGGLGEHFGVDPFWFRMAIMMGIVSAPIITSIYFLLVLFMPEAENES